MFGDHLLVAPVTMPEMDAWEVYLPGEEIWTHLWTEEEFKGPMTVKVEAPLGSGRHQSSTDTHSGTNCFLKFKTLSAFNTMNTVTVITNHKLNDIILSLN